MKLQTGVDARVRRGIVCASTSAHNTQRSTPMLGVGIIGGGRVAHAHARATAANGATLSLRGIAEVDAERAAALGERYDCPSYTDYHDLLAQPDVNVVTIALPNVLHASAAMDAIAAG